jgi:RNA polymerase sigma factor (sigma-70 family)
MLVSTYHESIPQGFLSDLAQAHLEPVLAANKPKDINASVLRSIETIARGLYFRSPDVSLDLDDLIQIGMIEAWRASERYQPSEVPFITYCLANAKGYMQKYITNLRHRNAISLDGYLTIETSDGEMQRELEAKPAQVQDVLASRSERRHALKLLQVLTEKQRFVIMAYFMIDSPQTQKAMTREQVQRKFNLSNDAYKSLKYRGMKKLRKVFAAVS